jgi:NTP pyrophosphatase (non-canonical NTP hydrolase)
VSARSDQQRVRAFIDEHGLRAGTPARLLDVTSELGELAKEYLERTNYGSTAFESGESWCEELGDVYYALICLAEESGVDLEQALERVLQKYSERLERRGSAGSTPDSL